MKVKELIEVLKNYPEAYIQIEGNGNIKYVACDEYPETGEILLVTLISYDKGT